MRTRWILASGAIMGWVLALSGAAFSAEPIKFGTSVKLSVKYYLPVLAAEEKGIWKRQGLDVEWIPFRSGGDLTRAVAANTVRIGFSATSTALQGAARGIPVVVVGELATQPDFRFWVRGNSPMGQPQEIKGARIGVSRLGDLSHVYGQVVAKVLGLQREVRFVGTGGMLESVAALKAGHIDIVINSPSVFMELKLKGEVRDLLDVSYYMPREWVQNIIFARREFAREDSRTVKAIIVSVFEAIDYLKREERWAVEKMKEMSGYSEQAARIMYKEGLDFSKDGKVRRKALENFMNLLTEYGIVPREKAPPLEELYTAGLAG